MAMAPERRLGIDSDSRFHRRTWKFERAGWMMIVLLLLAGSVGVFGQGPLSKRVAASPSNSLRVHYERMTRHGSTDRLRIDVAGAAATDTVVKVWIDHALFESAVVESVTPEVEAQTFGDRVIYEVRTPAPGSAVSLTFDLHRTGMWRERVSIGLVGGDSVQLTQFIFP
jgi:hypothetical protein